MFWNEKQKIFRARLVHGAHTFVRRSANSLITGYTSWIMAWLWMCPNESIAHRKRAAKRNKTVAHLIAIHLVAFSHLTQHVIIIIIMMQNYRTFVLFFSLFLHFPTTRRIRTLTEIHNSKTVRFSSQHNGVRWEMERTVQTEGGYLNANRSI